MERGSRGHDEPMKRKKYLKNVRQQYEAYPFPKRDPNDETRRLEVCALDMPAKINHYCFGGGQSFGNGFEVLVAGGGTGDTTIYLAESLRDFDARIVHLDMSATSIAIAKERATRRGLTAIEWVHDSLLDIPRLGLGSFDYINCAGVLHHLARPEEGLQALASVLADGGGMGLMVYGRYGRMDIYTVQDLLRLLQIPDEALPRRVARAIEVVEALPPYHWLFRGRSKKDVETVIRELKEDESNLFDAFLHEQDRSYTVPEIYDLVENCGLHIIAFTNYRNNGGILPLEYDPVFYVAGSEILQKEISERPDKERFAIAEALSGSMGLHSFYVSATTVRPVGFAEQDTIPCFLTDAGQANCRMLADDGGRRGVEVELRFRHRLGLDLDPRSKEALKLVDGLRTMGSIVDSVHGVMTLSGTATDRERLAALISDDFALLNSLNWIVGRKGDGAAFAPISGVDEAAAIASLDTG